MDLKYLFAPACIALLWGCSQAKKDADIKQSIAVIAKKETGFAGVNYTVSQGIVSLSGTCPGENMRNEVEETVKQIGGVRKVISNIDIGPVLLDSNFVLKQRADSILSKYAGVEASVRGSRIILSGILPKKDADKVVASLSQLHAAGIENRMRFK